MGKPLFIAKQGRHPSGVLGRVVAFIMARETRADNDRAIDLLNVSISDHVLDMGTGHGAAIRRLIRLAREGHVTGIDNSEIMLSVARRANHQYILSGQVTITCSDSADMPFDNDTFDKILSVHTVYFWDSIAGQLEEIRRVLRANGRIVLGFRPAEDKAVVAKFPTSVYRFQTTDALTESIENAGLMVRDTARVDQSGRSMVWIAAENPPPNMR